MDKLLCCDICEVLQGFSQNETPSRLIQKLFRGMHSHCACHSAALILKNPKTDYLEIKHSFNIYKDAVQSFRRPVGTGIIAKLFFTEPLVCVTPKAKSDYEELKIQEGFQTAIAVRISSHAHTQGYLVVFFTEKKAMEEEMKCFLTTISALISAMLEKEELEELVRELRRTNPKTGLLTPRYFMQRLVEELSKCQRYKLPLVTALLDIDNYKTLIDLHGLLTAQEILRCVSEELKACIRGIDVMGHFGVDEFVLLLPITPLSNVETVTKRFAQNLARREFGREKIKTTLSIGIASMKPGDTAESLMLRTQVAFHQARLAGIGQIRIIS